MSTQTHTLKVEVDYVDLISKALADSLAGQFSGRTVRREEIADAEVTLRELLSLLKDSIGRPPLCLKLTGSDLVADVKLAPSTTVLVKVATHVRVESKHAALERVMAAYFGKPLSSLQPYLPDLHAAVLAATGERIHAANTGRELKVAIKDGDYLLACSVPLVSCRPVSDADLGEWLRS